MVRIFYGWIIAGVVSLAWAISIGPRQAFPVFLLAFVTDFGWSRTATAAAFSIHMSSYALGGWVLGVLVDRLGPRRVIAWRTAAWVLTLLLCSVIQNLWQLYVIFGVVGGVATSGLAYVPNNALLSRWFIRYRGMAAGIAQAGVPLGAAVYGPLAQLGIAAVGWRGTHVVFGLFVAATALPLVLLLLQDDPQEKGLTPDGIPWSAAEPNRSVAMSQRVVGFSRPGLPRGYWVLFGANVFRGMTMYAILVHQVAYFGLWLVRNPAQVVFLSVFVVASGMAAGGNPPVFAAFLTDRLQGPRFGFLLGLQNIGFGIGATLGPLLTGAQFDLTGDYTLALVLMAASIVVSSVVISGATRPSPKFSS
jgi:MFS family permease